MTVKDLTRLFPIKASQIEQLTKTNIRQAKKRIKDIIAIPDSERTFANTAKALDNILTLSDAAIFSAIIELLEMVSPEEDIRQAAHKASVKLRSFFIDVASNKELYNAFKAYVQTNTQKEDLTDEQRYFLTELMNKFKRNGLELPDDQLEKVKALKKEITQLLLDFEKNISIDNSTITVDRSALEGLDQKFIAGLKQTEDGDYILGVDYPTYFAVMQNVIDSQTRKRLYTAFTNRAYPANEDILKKIIQKRDQLAKLLGFQSFAHFDLTDQMAKNPEKVRAFLDKLIQRADKKEAQEFGQMMDHVPSSIPLTDDGKLCPWDRPFVKEQFKKKQYAVDEQKIAEYFPVEKTIQGLLSIYESFLSLRFKEVPVHGLWSNDVRLIQVFDKETDQLLGYIFLDLYPRANKYSHGASTTIIPAIFDKNGKRNVAISSIITNFPKATGTMPALFKRDDVSTFFHEFGHALHTILGRTHMGYFSGTHVKDDFVELPSQMLEEWLWDKQILKQISGHWQTGEPLPDELIDRILQTKHIATGYGVQQGVLLSLISLLYYLEGEQKDINQLYKQLTETVLKHTAYEPTAHFYTSFGHLSDYAAKYYCYLWSKVLALDLFSEIKKNGLLNPEIGKKYINEVIGRGGSVDPNELLRTFLGREPSDEAFFKDMGL